MKYISVIIMFFSLNLQGQVTRRERVVVFDSYPKMIEVIKSFRNDSLLFIDAIFTARNGMHPQINDFETFYYGDAREFFSWLVDLESVMNSEIGSMKILHECDVYVKGFPRDKNLEVYLKEKSCFAYITPKELKTIKTDYYKWCMKNKINLSE